MKFKDAMNEAIPQSDSANLAMAAKYAGTSEPHKVDWKSGKGGETDLGKRYMKRKKKKKKAKS